MSTGLKANSDGSAAIQVGGTDVITLTSGGAATFVTSPTTVQAGTAAAPSITFSGDTNTGIYSPGADTIAFTEGGVESMRIDSSGNVGIGTSSPDYRLDVSATGTTVSSAFRSNQSEMWMMLKDSGTTLGHVRLGSSSGAMLFYSGNAQTAVLNSSGNFVVGATSGVVGAERISVDAGSNRGIVLKTSSSSNELVGCWNSATAGNNRFSIFWTETSATERGSIDYNRTGGLTRYNTTSDATLKNIIGDSDGQKSVEILSTTRIREYAWKDDEQQKTQIGVIAQELYETYKGAVSVGGDIKKTDEEGNVTTEYRPWGVDKTAFTFHLIAGWQAHEKMIQELKAEIAALKGA